MAVTYELIPGHHLQFATAAQHPAFIRRIFNASEHAEGWTTMLEDYMLDAGYISDDLVDEVRFIAKRDISRLVARVGIDLYFMTTNKDYLDMGLGLCFDSQDVFENAALLLKEATGFTMREINRGRELGMMQEADDRNTALSNVVVVANAIAPNHEQMKLEF